MRGCSCRGTAGFAHVSCLAEQAKILVAEAEENNLDNKVRFEVEAVVRVQHVRAILPRRRSVRARVGLLEKARVGRPEDDGARIMAISVLGNGFFDSKQYEDALAVQEVELLSMKRRVGSRRRLVRSALCT